MPHRPIFQRYPKPWRTTSTKRVASLGRVELHLDRLIAKNGFRMNHPRLVLHDFSIIVPVVDRNKLVFVWNYRPPIRGWELELPQDLSMMTKALRNVQGGSLLRRLATRPELGGNSGGFMSRLEYQHKEPTYT